MYRKSPKYEKTTVADLAVSGVITAGRILKVSVLFILLGFGLVLLGQVLHILGVP